MSIVLVYTTTSANTLISVQWGAATGTITVNWGDTTSATFTYPYTGFNNSTGGAVHTYTTAGTYTITITGAITQYGTGNQLYGYYLLKQITSWDNGVIVSFNDAFNGGGAGNLTSVPATLPPTLRTLYRMFFQSTSSISSNISSWNTSNITDMSYMFYQCSSFNQALNSWNTINVTSMSNMFYQSAFNSVLSGWNVSNVKDTSNMFYQSSFNQDISAWNTINVTSMNGMFRGNITFNYPLPNWNVTNVRDMNVMFYQAFGFNSSLANWNTINVTDMSSMFSDIRYNGGFNQNINSWNVSNVRNMNRMFGIYNSTFNQPLNSWNTINVTDMAEMFNQCAAFNQPLNNWNTSNVGNMGQMFQNATAFNQPINYWNVSKVGNMNDMFASATAFNQPLNNWDVSRVSVMDRMFQNATAFNQPLNGWIISNVTSMVNMTWGMSTNNWSITLIGWASQTVKSSVSIDTSSKYYAGATVSRSVLTSAPNSWSITDGGLLAGSISNPYITLIYTVPSYGQVSLPLTTISGTATVDWGDGMMTTFTSSGTTPIHTYITAASYVINISGTVTAYGANSGVTGISYLTRAIWLNNGALTSLSNAFYRATNLTFVVNQISATVTDLSYTFYGARYFNQSLSLWNISNVTTMASMFTNSGLGPYGYSGTLVGWATQTVKPNVALNVGTVKYLSTAVSARTTLTSTPNFWTITDGNAVASISLVYTVLANTSVAAPVVTSSGTLSYDWGDGNINSITPHTYVSAGTYTLKMYGAISRFSLSSQPAGYQYLKSCLEWDNGYLTSLQQAFFCNTTGNVTSVPTTLPSTVTTINGIFNQCTSFNGNISGWDVSRVTDMTNAFSQCSIFNTSINTWDVSNVTSMFNMLNYIPVFNKPLSNWNTINVKDMRSMFVNSTTFNQSLNTWNTSNVTNMNSMFYNAPYNQPLNSWNTINVTDMGSMFTGASVFNQPINSWNVSNVNTMRGMFQYASVFNQPLNSWNTINVADMYIMFNYALAFNQPLNYWNTSNVTSMNQMFANQTVFNGDVSTWNTINVRDMQYIFGNGTKFNQNLANWTIVTCNMSNFNSTSDWSGRNYSATLIGWASKTITPSSTLGLTSVQYFPSAVASRSILTSAPNNWNITGDTLVTAIQLVYKTPSAGLSIVLPLTTLTGTVTVTWGDTSSSSFTVSGLTAPHTYSAAGTYIVTITGTVTAFGANTGVTGIQYLTDVYSLENGAITNLTNAFYAATSLISVPVFLPTTVVQIPYMFALASSFNQDISTWVTTNVTDMNNLFNSASSFNVSLGSWNISNVTNMASMFQNSGLSSASYSSTLVGWATQTVKSNVNLGAGTITYYNTQKLSALSARNILTSSPNNWIITDGGGVASPVTTQNYTISVSRNSDSQTVFTGYFVVLTSVTPNIVTNFYDYSQPISTSQITGVTTYADIYINDGLHSEDSSFNTVTLRFSPGGTNINVTNNTFFTNLDGNNRVQFYSNSSNSFYTFGSPSVTNLGDYSGLYTITINAMQQTVTCFKRGTKILCFIDDQEKYIPVEDISNKTLVKTFQNGYVKIHQIGKSNIANSGTGERIKDRLYKLTREEFPELFEDLYLTGAHCLLVEEIERETYNYILKMFGNILMTDGMIRLMAYLDNRSTPYCEDTMFEIWHFALEHHDPFVNYGVYANGLLVETASKRWMKDHSGMEIIG